MILHHTGYKDDHYDLMLERDGVLKTWALDGLDFSAARRATPKADHRLAYLGHEGPVSGDRGQVRRVDEGTYEASTGGILRFDGRVLKGEFRLRPKDGSDAVWTLEKGG